MEEKSHTDPENDAKMTLPEALGKMQERLYAFILALTVNPQDASDVLQEANLDILKNASSFNPDFPYWPWFKQFALNAVRHYRRNAAKGSIVFSSELVDQLAESVPDERAGSGDDQQVDRIKLLSVCMKKLKPWQRDLLKNRYSGNTALAPLAKSLHVTPLSLANLFYYLRQTLRACIQRFMRKAQKLDEGKLLFIKEMEDLYDGVATEEQKGDFAEKLAAGEEYRSLYLAQTEMIALMTVGKKTAFADEPSANAKPTYRVRARLAALAAGILALLAGGAALLFNSQRSNQKPKDAGSPVASLKPQKPTARVQVAQSQLATPNSQTPTLKSEIQHPKSNIPVPPPPKYIAITKPLITIAAQPQIKKQEKVMNTGTIALAKHTETARVKRVLAAAGIAAAALGVSATETNVWINTDGGNWHDAANWSNGVVPLAYAKVADFSLLPSGKTVSITNGADWTLCGTLVFGNGESATADSVWTLRDSISWGGMRLALSNGICVATGRLNLASDVRVFSTNILAKTGAGDLRLTGTSQLESGFRVEEGTLTLATANPLPKAPVYLRSEETSPLRLLTDSQIGNLLNENRVPLVIPLDGHTLSFGGTQNAALLDEDFRGPGKINAWSGDYAVLAASQTNTFALATQNGNLYVGRPDPVAFYRFDDASNAGLDSGTHGNSLLSVGSPAVVTDSERGSVLSLDGNSYLKGAGTLAAINGLPCSNDEFTVAFWMKPASDINATAILFSWGLVGYANGQYVGLRVNKEGNNLFYGNQGNNTAFGLLCNIYNGAWHHIALSQRGGTTSFYVDGTPWGNTSITLIEPPVYFQVGKSALYGAWMNNAGFKGLMDDFLLTDYAMTRIEIAWLAKDDLAKAGLFQSVTIPQNVSVEANLNGKTVFNGSATVGTLGGKGLLGAVSVGKNGVLTAAGIGSATATVYRAGIECAAFVKDGADYALTLTGTSSYTGKTTVAAGTLTLRAPIITDSLAAYYRFDDPADPWADSSAQGFDLTASGSGMALAAGNGVYGGAASFPGSGYLSSGSATYPDAIPLSNTCYTVSFWVKPDSGCDSTAPIFLWGQNTANNCNFMRLNGNPGVMSSHNGDNFDVTLSSLRDGKWHHIVTTYDQTNFAVYCDGAYVAKKQNQSLKVLKKGPFYLGANAWNTIYYKGLMDEFAVYNRALGAQEIASLYAGMRPLAETEESVATLPDPVAYYAFDDASNLGKDSGPYGYDLHSVSNKAVITADSPVSGSMLDLRNGMDYLAIDTFPAHLPTNNADVSISCWAKISDSKRTYGLVYWGDTSGYCHLLGNDFPSSGEAIRYIVKSGIYGGVTTDSDVVNVFRGPGTLPWHHIVAVWSSEAQGRQVLYVDGVKSGIVNYPGATINVPARDFFIGMKTSSLAKQEWPEGLIDEVRVYDFALSEGQVRTLARHSDKARAHILPESTMVDIAAGATLKVSGAIQRVSGVSGAGTVLLDSGFLAVAGSVTNTFSGTLAGYGRFGALDGAKVTLGSASALERGSELVASNATLNVAADLGTNAVIIVKEDGVLTASTNITCDVSYESGAKFVPGSTVTIEGTATLAADCVVDASGKASGIYPLLNAAAYAGATPKTWQVLNLRNKNLLSKIIVNKGTVSVNIYSRGTVVMLL